jgi:hypothetical protein
VIQYAPSIDEVYHTFTSLSVPKLSTKSIKGLALFQLGINQVKLTTTLCSYKEVCAISLLTLLSHSLSKIPSSFGSLV